MQCKLNMFCGKSYYRIQAYDFLKQSFFLTLIIHKASWNGVLKVCFVWLLSKKNTNRIPFANNYKYSMLEIFRLCYFLSVNLLIRLHALFMLLKQIQMDFKLFAMITHLRTFCTRMKSSIKSWIKIWKKNETALLISKCFLKVSTK